MPRPANRPIDLHQDERYGSLLRGATTTKFPWLLPNGHYDNLAPGQKAQLTEEQLRILSTDEEGEPRWRAMEILGLLRERRSLPRLHAILHDPGHVVRYRQCWVAVRALYRIADRQSIPTLIRAARHVHAIPRAGASFTLQKLTGQHFRTPAEWERWWAAEQQERR